MKRIVKWEHSKEAMSEVLSIVNSNTTWKDNGFGRRFVSHLTNFDKYRDSVFALFGLTDVLPEPLFGNFIGNHYSDNAFIHEHTDFPNNEYVHARCNLLITKPLEGGMPIINGKEYNLEEADVWLCIAGRELHSSTPIKGGQRLTLSIGGLVSKKQIDDLQVIIS